MSPRTQSRQEGLARLVPGDGELSQELAGGARGPSERPGPAQQAEASRASPGPRRGGLLRQRLRPGADRHARRIRIGTGGVGGRPRRGPGHTAEEGRGYPLTLESLCERVTLALAPTRRRAG